MNPRPLLLLALAAALRAPAAEPAPKPPAPAPATSPAPAAVKPTPTAPAASGTPVVTPPAAPAKRDRSSRNTPAAPTPATGPLTFESFRLVSDRNIFNANRTGRRDRTEEQAPRLDVITLVGTMESDRGLRAFFDGSNSAFRKALRVGESIDKFKITAIAPTTVSLERDGKDTAVLVGQQLRRPDGGDWKLVGADIVRAEAAAMAAKADAGKINPSAPVVIPANVDDVTRRLMEKRNQDLKK
ncbi:MAG: hypothetical protein RLZZ15_2240 [Verrucomicrobiota bacterium]|jgi:hypothetical protein